MLKNQYRACQICNTTPHKRLVIDGYPPNCRMEDGFYSDSAGKISIPCPACKGTGLIWGNIY